MNGREVRAVRDVSLDIGKGDILGIVGTSGAGKSTVLNCINLLERPDCGEVFVDGVELTNLSKSELQTKRRDIGMIFQNFNLFTQRSVMKNIIYPLKHTGMTKAEKYKRGMELLELVGIPDKKDVYPGQLSGGQQQRVAIARALASNPKILLCDEATSALDPDTTAAILSLLKDINRKLGITIVLITHQQEVVKQICSKVVLMENGEIAEISDTVDFFTNPQTSSGESFVGSLIENSKDKDRILPYLNEASGGSKIYQLTFLSNDAKNPTVAEASKKFNTQIAILFGEIEFISDKIVGNLVVSIGGTETECLKTIDFFKANKIAVREVKKHD